MRTILKITLFFIGFLASIVYAQEKTITGIITDSSGETLPGVYVEVKGTQNSAETDVDGKYEIHAKKGDVLIFSFIGLPDIEKTIGQENLVNVQFSENDNQIDQVVVTALGITRDKKSLGYAVQEVDGDLLAEARNTNPLTSLSGNVAGVQISTPSGNMGGSAKILLRGAGSVTQNNRPLIVVDGIPLANNNVNSSNTQRGAGGRDYGDTGFDINPDDIEKISVLKGGPASALYGSRGQNGVILITTKKGKKGRTQITVNSGVSFEEVAIMPDLQNQYGGGSSDTFSTVTIDGKEYNVASYAVDESWGPKFDPNVKVLHWDAFDPEFSQDYLRPRAWTASPNDVESFFNTGVTYNNNVSLAKSFEGTNLRFSLGNVMTKGIVPNSNLRKNTFNFYADTKLSEKLTGIASFTYANTDGFNRPEVGYGDNSVSQKFFQWGQRQLDFNRLKRYKLADGSQRVWNRTAFDNATPKYADNPYWTINENISEDNRDRYYGKFELKYDIMEGMYAVARVMGDAYSFDYNERVVIGSQANSSYKTFDSDFKEFNYEARLHYDKDLSDKLNINTFIGVNRRHNVLNELEMETQGGLAIDDIYNISNSNEPPKVREYNEDRRINSVFGGFSLGYNDMLFVDVAARNDWSSTLPVDNNSYFYPSLTGSFVFSKVIDASFLNFGKIRAGWANVGNDATPYQLVDVYVNNPPFHDNPHYLTGNTKRNPNLGPENKETLEFGIEASMFKNRFGFDVTYYREKTTDLITRLEVDGAGGYKGGQWINAGEMTNRGWEVLLRGTPLKTADFQWDVAVNFSTNDNTLESLYEDVSSLQLVNAPFNVSLQAIVGESYGQIMGTDFVYDQNGNKVVSETGRYESSTIKSLGSILPDYNMGIRNSFNYKDFSLGILFDIQQGGKYFSTTHMFGMYSGMLEETAANGIRENGIVLDGVLADGTQNTTNISALRWAGDHYSGPAAQNVFDSDYIKLRELTFGYTLPKDLTGDFLESIKFSAFARNLFTWGLDYDGIDPEMTTYGSGNVQGLEGGSLPSTRTYGFNVQFKF